MNATVGCDRRVQICRSLATAGTRLSPSLRVEVLPLARYSKLRSLFVHYVAQASLRAARTHEYWLGFVAFAKWIPNLARHLPGLVAKNQQSSADHSRITLAILPTTYINLDRRQDRRRQIERELSSIGLSNFTRFSAIPDANGSLGCAKSHLKVLQTLASQPGDLFMVCEDDLTFSSNQEEVEAVLQDFLLHPHLDVLCLAYRLKAPRLRLTRRLAIANGIQTASAYILRKRAIPILIESFSESRDMLSAGVPKSVASIDIHWKKKQSSSLIFAISTPPLARQRRSYSDIANQVKDYGN